MVAATCISRRSSGSASSHSARCSARSRSSAAASISPSIDGVSRTATAPGPNGSMARPKRCQFVGARSASRSTSSASSSTISGISRIWRATPDLLERRLHALVDQPLVRGVLIDDHQPVAGLRDDVGVVHLRARGAERTVEHVGRGLGHFDARGRGAPPTSNAACAASAKPGGCVGRGPCGDARRAARAGPRRASAASRSAAARGQRGRAGTPRWSRCRRWWRRAGLRGPGPPSARASAASAPAARRGSAPRSWPDARSRRPRAAAA